MDTMTRLLPERPDLSRTTKAVQHYVEVLEMRLRESRERLAEGPADSDTFLDPYSDVPRPLGKGAKIEYAIGPRQHFQTHLVDGVLEVRSDGDPLAIYPRVSNVVEIRMERRHG